MDSHSTVHVCTPHDCLFIKCLTVNLSPFQPLGVFACGVFVYSYSENEACVIEHASVIIVFIFFFFLHLIVLLEYLKILGVDGG